VQVLESIDDEQLDRLTERDEFFWLDVVAPTGPDVRRLGERFGWHELVVEDMCHFRQRAKLDSYEDYSFLVFYGAHHENGEPALMEVHLVVSGSYVVTVRHNRCDDLEEARKRLVKRSHDVAEQFVVYSILDALTDSFFPVLEEIDDTIDTLENSIVSTFTGDELSNVFRLKRLVTELRRAVAPQRDLAARALDELADIPGLDAGTRDYFRDLYDHLIRINDLLDSYRDLLTSVMDVYLSTQSNRLNEVMKRLTVISVVFLPLTFITGFFGQNFGWLVRHINSLPAFIVLGGGGLILPLVVLYVLLTTRGWLR
jgi:magnesium transporter